VTGLEFLVEWEEAPTVRSPVLAATWARLEIRVHGRPITRFWSEPTNAIRAGVHGSMFPLARWIAHNWWHLLVETIPVPAVLDGARQTHSFVRPWMERHNLVYAREGMAYPDLSIYREDDLIGLRWLPDPEDVTTPGRFLGEGAAHLHRAEVEAGLANLVDSVIARTADLAADEVEALRADWSASQSAGAGERSLCERLAALGLDPYAPEPDAEIEELLATDLGLPQAVLNDLFAAATRDRLLADLETARVLLTHLPVDSEAHERTMDSAPYDPRPYRTGYRRAEALRHHFGLDPAKPVDDLPALLERQVGPIQSTWIPAGERQDIEAAVERNGVCALVAGERPARAQRFLLARALHHWQFVTRGSSEVRLLTRARDWQQSASRAFAAELLAPAKALAVRLRGESGWEFQSQLADEFQVDAKVIAHQLENHKLG
jgi:hypothetical protein